MKEATGNWKETLWSDLWRARPKNLFISLTAGVACGALLGLPFHNVGMGLLFGLMFGLLMSGHELIIRLALGLPMALAFGQAFGNARLAMTLGLLLPFIIELVLVCKRRVLRERSEPRH